jgi:RNA polymerase-binding transcription factor DksA
MIGVVTGIKRTAITSIAHTISVRIGLAVGVSYGVCEKTGKLIGKARLKAMPTARLCIEAQEEEEQAARRNG